MLRRAFLSAVALAVCVTTALWAYQHYLRPFRVVLVRISDADWSLWEAAARRTPYTLHRFEGEDLNALPVANYNLVVIRAQGLNLSDEQVERFRAARSRGTHFLLTTPTNEVSRQQNSLPAAQQAVVQEYLQHGGEDNLVGLLHYAAREIGGKEVRVPELVKRPLAGFFHLGDAVFESLEDYEAWLAERRSHWDPHAPRVAIIGSMVNPYETLNRSQVDYMLRSLESQGARVYPIFGSRESLALLEAARPDLVIIFPHGRLATGNGAVSLLERLDCPCISALALLTDQAEWLADARGMAGNYLSQSITTPELDGVIEPVPVTSMEPNERGIRVRTVLGDRIEKRIALALNWLALRRKLNAEKRVVIVYYKDPGSAALSAGGLEVGPSLFNTLKRMQQEGYDLGNALPDTPAQLQDLIQAKGKTLGQWAVGAYEQFLETADPEWVSAEDYAVWFRRALSEQRQRETIELWGPIPGKKMAAERDDRPYLIVSRIRFGNVVIMPQPTVGGGDEGENEVAAIHGTDQAPPHFYLGAYLWARFGFQADAIVHFGTHGSLEFTYGKSVCLSRDCWPDILIGDLPHVYPYVINNVGEAMIAKRRANAVLVSHLTPPFSEAGLYGELSVLHDKIHDWQRGEDAQLREETRRTITDAVGQLKLAEDLALDAGELDTRLLDDAEIDRLHNYIHRLKDESITDGLHELGRPFEEHQVRSTVTQMLGNAAVTAVLAALGLSQHPDASEVSSDLVRGLVETLESGQLAEPDFFSPEVLSELRADSTAHSTETGDADAKQSAAEPPLLELRSRSFDGVAFWRSAGAAQVRQLSNRRLQRAFLNVLDSIHEFADALRRSPQQELDRFIQALRGGYIPPSSGGDPLINPDSVPTGRNLFGVDAEQAPSEEAWRVGCRLANEILAEQVAKRGRYPRRIAFSLWGGEFIRDRGTGVAQILYLLGVRPVRNSRGSVYDIELISSDELGRPRIDVLVQTSGQFRDIGASRIALMDKAVRLVSTLEAEKFPNFVREGTVEAELTLKKRGVAPAEARDFATARIFGAAGNRSYGTDIMGVVEKGDTWENEQEVADRYVRNMGGFYRDGSHWGTYQEGLLEAQMQGTEAVVHPRSSNTSGPLSLDHVYEFMGGITLAVRAKTGVDPTGYFSDLRKRGQARATTAVSAIREEARTTIWNPKFLEGLQREGASAAGSLTETVRNLYGWNVMQPSAVNRDLWDETYSVLIDDKHELAMRAYFEQKNPFALQDMTAVMLETARKGYWTPGDETLHNLAEIHAELVEKHGAGCSYETCGNRKLQDYVRGKLLAPGGEADPQLVASYQASLASVLQSSQPLPEVEGITLDEKADTVAKTETAPGSDATPWLAALILALSISLLSAGYRKSRASLVYEDRRASAN